MLSGLRAVLILSWLQPPLVEVVIIVRFGLPKQACFLPGGSALIEVLVSPLLEGAPGACDKFSSRVWGAF